MYFMPFDQFMQDGSLASMEGRGKTQDWYFQAYAMVRFLLNPSGGMSPSNRMQFEQFTRLIAQTACGWKGTCSLSSLPV